MIISISGLPVSASTATPNTPDVLLPAVCTVDNPGLQAGLPHGKKKKKPSPKALLSVPSVWFKFKMTRGTIFYIYIYTRTFWHVRCASKFSCWLTWRSFSVYVEVTRRSPFLWIMRTFQTAVKNRFTGRLLQEGITLQSRPLLPPNFLTTGIYRYLKTGHLVQLVSNTPFNPHTPGQRQSE